MIKCNIMPEQTLIKGAIELQAYSLFLKRQVSLRRQTWLDHILPQHPELKGKLPLIKQLIEDSSSNILRYRRKSNPMELAFFLKCEYFQPYNTHLKLALKILSDSEAIVTTAEGFFERHIPPLGMEKI